MPGCPTVESLQDFLRDGDLSGDLVEHIENCDECGRIVEELCSTNDDDAFPLKFSVDTNAEQDLKLLERLAVNRAELEGNDQVSSPIVFPGGAPGTLGVLDCYHILRRIDGGGFGEVFEARDMQLDRTVALKVVRATAFSGAGLSRFQNEAKAAGAIRHENVVVLHRVLEPTPEFPYPSLVMEYVTGGSLRRRLENDAAIDIEQTLRWMIQAAHGLAAVHSGGILHRDLKPANLLIDGTGRLKITDFGLARPLSDEVQSANMAGTPAYMSPEQIRTPDCLTEQSDIYGLGVVLYQLLAGVRPFQGKDEVLRQQILESPPPSIRKFNPRVSRDIETVCLRCLHKEPSRRFARAEDLAEDLENCLAGRPINSRPIGKIEKASWWVRSNPTLTTVLVGLMLVSIASAVVARKFQVMQRSETQAKQAAQASEAIAEKTAADTVDSLGLVIAQFKDQIGDPNRLVPIYQDIAKRLEYIRVPADKGDEKDGAAAESHLRLAMIYDGMAPTLNTPEIVEKATTHFEAAIALLEPLRDSQTSKLISAYDGYAENYRKRGRLDEAEQLQNKVLTFCEERLQTNPDDLEMLRNSSIALEALAVIAGQRGKDAVRTEQLQKCLALRERIATLKKDDQSNHELANVLVFLGDATRNPPKPENRERAAQFYQRAISLSESVVNNRPQEFSYMRTLANAYDRMGLCVEDTERPAWTHKALALREKINRLDPLSRSSLRDLLVSYIGSLSQTRDSVEVKRTLDLSHELVDHWLSLDSQDLQAINFASRVALGYCDWYSDRSEFETALKYAERAVALRRQMLQLSPSAASRRALVVGLKSLGDVRLALDQSADEVIDEQISILEQMVDAHENEAEMREWLEEIRKLKADGAKT